MTIRRIKKEDRNLLKMIKNQMYKKKAKLYKRITTILKIYSNELVIRIMIYINIYISNLYKFLSDLIIILSF